jgi:hypothetical protein
MLIFLELCLVISAGQQLPIALISIMYMHSDMILDGDTMILFGQLPLYCLRISTICIQLTCLNSTSLEKISVDSHIQKDLSIVHM